MFVYRIVTPLCVLWGVVGSALAVQAQVTALGKLAGEKVAVVVFAHNDTAERLRKNALSRLEGVLADNDITVLDREKAEELGDVFRTLDAFRVFDLIYVLTGGGPGTATEPLALYAFQALLQDLRFGFGSALSVILFAVSFSLAWLYIRLVGRDLLGRGR